MIAEKRRCSMAELQKKQTEKENIVELKTNIYLLSIIGEVEGHESLGDRTKATRYEHILPALARVEEDKTVDGLLILLNTVGGDVEAGLAIAEMIASMRKPAVSLVLGGGHSIGVPLAVAADYSLIVPSATMILHPVRTNGMFIGVPQTWRNMEKTQDRITGFVSTHSGITKERLEELMLDTRTLVKDVGTMLDGPQAVEEGLIDEVGGIARALEKLNELIEAQKDEPEPVVLTKPEVKRLLEDCGVAEEKLDTFDQQYELVAGDAPSLMASNIASPRKFEVKTPDVVVKIDPERAELIETKVIDGRKCLVIPMEGEIEVNGICVHMGNLSEDTEYPDNEVDDE